MQFSEEEIFGFAQELGFESRSRSLYDLADWLREEKQIHVEIGSIWDELTNIVESYCYTITAPVNIYYFEPVYASGGRTHKEMLLKGLSEALTILHKYNKQKTIEVSDDELIIAYLKGYGDKDKRSSPPQYRTNVEKYAYLQGRQGDYIAEGLTEDNIAVLVRNVQPDQENLRLEN